MVGAAQLKVAGGVAAGAIAIDQGAKAWVRDHHEQRELRAHDGRIGSLPVVWDPPGTDEFALVYTENEGALLGRHGNEGSKRLVGSGLGFMPAVVGATLYSGATLSGRGAGAMRAASSVGAGLLAAGVLSNGIEKLARDRVTDYLFVSRTMIAWNGADITLGAGGLLSAGAIGLRVVRGFRG